MDRYKITAIKGKLSFPLGQVNATTELGLQRSIKKMIKKSYHETVLYIRPVIKNWTSIEMKDFYITVKIEKL